MTEIGDSSTKDMANTSVFNKFSPAKQTQGKYATESKDTTVLVELATYEELHKNRHRLWRYLENTATGQSTNPKPEVAEGSGSKNVAFFRRKDYGECFFRKLEKHYEVIHKPILSFWGDDLD